MNSKETTFSGSIREKNHTMYEDIIYSEYLKANTNLHQLCSTPTALPLRFCPKKVSPVQLSPFSPASSQLAPVSSSLLFLSQILFSLILGFTWGWLNLIKHGVVGYVYVNIVESLKGSGEIYGNHFVLGKKRLREKCLYKQIVVRIWCNWFSLNVSSGLDNMKNNTMWLGLISNGFQIGLGNNNCFSPKCKVLLSAREIKSKKFQVRKRHRFKNK